MNYLLGLVGYVAVMLLAALPFGVQPTFWEALWVIVAVSVGAAIRDALS